MGVVYDDARENFWRKTAEEWQKNCPENCKTLVRRTFAFFDLQYAWNTVLYLNGKNFVKNECLQTPTHIGFL